MTKTQGWILVIGILVLIALSAVCLLNLVRSPWQAFVNLPGQAATTVAEITHPTPTIYPDPVVVIQQVRSLAKLETVQYSIEKVITAESGQGPFGFLFGDRLLLIAHGKVIAGIDLAKLQTADVRVDTSSGTVSIILPPAELFTATLENDKTYVYSRDSAIFAPSQKSLETLARKEAENQIRDAALADGILQVAMTNGQAFLQRFVLSLGYRQVVFLVASPIPSGATATHAPMATATP